MLLDVGCIVETHRVEGRDDRAKQIIYLTENRSIWFEQDTLDVEGWTFRFSLDDYK